MREVGHEQEDTLRQFIEIWNDLTRKEAERLVEESKGNLFNAQLIKERNAQNLEEIIMAEKSKNPELFSALAHLYVGDIWFSPLSKS